LKLVEETRDNADILAMRTGSLKGSLGDTHQSRPGEATDELKEMRERLHLLTEENHVLFE